VARFESLLPVLGKREMSLTALAQTLSAGHEDAPAFASVSTLLTLVAPELPAGTRAHFDPTLVRGMGYYTGTIFEMVSPAFPSSIAGGGRYDRMVGRLLGREVPACGFSIGFERLIAILGERQQAPQPAATQASESRRIALLIDGEADLPRALPAARALRTSASMVSLELRRKNARKQLDDLQAHGFSEYATLEAGSASAVVRPLRRDS
jgi:histidyl-tRNA synthetase